MTRIVDDHNPRYRYTRTIIILLLLLLYVVSVCGYTRTIFYDELIFLIHNNTIWWEYAHFCDIQLFYFLFIKYYTPGDFDTQSVWRRQKCFSSRRSFVNHRHCVHVRWHVFHNRYLYSIYSTTKLDFRAWCLRRWRIAQRVGVAHSYFIRPAGHPPKSSEIRYRVHISFTWMSFSSLRYSYNNNNVSCSALQ